MPRHMQSGVWCKALACFGVLNSAAGKGHALTAAEAHENIPQTHQGLPLEIRRTPCISGVPSATGVHGASLPSAVPGPTDPTQQIGRQAAYHLENRKHIDDLCYETVGQAGNEEVEDSRLHETELFMESLLSDMKAIACAVSTLDTALSMDPQLFSARSASVVETSIAGFHDCHATGRAAHGKQIAPQLDEAEDHSTPGYFMDKHQKLSNDCRDRALACCNVAFHPSCATVASKSGSWLSTTHAINNSMVAATAFSVEVLIAPSAVPSPTPTTAAQRCVKAKGLRCEAFNAVQRHPHKTQPLEFEAAFAIKPCALSSSPSHESPWGRSSCRSKDNYCTLPSTSQKARFACCAFHDSDAPLSDPHDDTTIDRMTHTSGNCRSNNRSDSVAVGCGEDAGEPLATRLGNACDPDRPRCSSQALPCVVHTLTNLLSDVGDLSCLCPQSGGGCVWQGTWRGMRVALKVFCCPGSQPDSPQLLAAVRASRLHHRNLATVYDVRVCQVDERALSELDPPPLLRQGWARAPRPMGRLQLFLAAHSECSLEPPQSNHCTDVDLTVFPGDMVVRTLAPATPDRQLLRSLCPELGSCVVAVFMEHCDMHNLLTIALSADSPFHASRSWPVHVARRALLRTAREVASGLVALHTAGVTHGSLHPANVLCCRAPNDRRGFVARLADAGWTNPLAAGWRSRVSGPRMVMLAPEALMEGGGGKGGSAALDVYAFGMLLYVMAAGQVPFRGQHLVPVLRAVATEGLRPEWPTGQHDHLEPLFLRCMAQSPEDRPSAKQILSEICALEDTLKSSKTRRAKTGAVAVAAKVALPSPEANE